MLSPGVSALNAEFFTKRARPEQRTEAVNSEVLLSPSRKQTGNHQRAGADDGDGSTLQPAQETLKDDGVFTGDFLDEA